jgi:hypothetical protein
MESLPEINFIEQKRKQEKEVYEKINPKNKFVVKNLIMDYDFSKNTFLLPRKHFGNYKNLYDAFQKYFLERKEFLNKLIEKF